MALVRKTAKVNYRAEQLFQLVVSSEYYPDFLPWCESAFTEPLSGEDQVRATIVINFCGIRQSFSTINHYIKPTVIEMQLDNGPFKYLNGQWTFTELDNGLTEVQLYLDYEFSNFILARILSPIFDVMTGTLMESFIQRAAYLYGK